MLDEIVFARRSAGHAAAAARLAAVSAYGEPLDEAVVGDGHHDLLFGDHVFDAELFRLVDDLRPPFVAVFLLDLQKLLPDNLHLELLARKDCPKLLNQLNRLAVFLLDFLPLESGQPLQPHVKDGFRLDLGELELLHEAGFRDLHVTG